MENFKITVSQTTDQRQGAIMTSSEKSLQTKVQTNIQEPLQNDIQKNADRFTGFADVYDTTRPKSPEKVKEIILRYLGKKPSVVVDLGCGTGLSTLMWSGVATEVIGIEPSQDMITIALQKAKHVDQVRFITGFSDATGLEDDSVDIVTCSQSFHWMEPEKTLEEVSRILKKNGVFAVYDCDWPPVCHWEAEKAYMLLFDKVNEFELARPELKEQYKSWPKDKHLMNIKKSDKFQFAREIVFSTTEPCDAKRFIDLALSQGGLQAILKLGLVDFKPHLSAYKEKIKAIFGEEHFDVEFSYRMRIAVK